MSRDKERGAARRLRHLRFVAPDKNGYRFPASVRELKTREDGGWFGEWVTRLEPGWRAELVRYGLIRLVRETNTHPHGNFHKLPRGFIHAHAQTYVELTDAGQALLAAHPAEAPAERGPHERVNRSKLRKERKGS